MKSNLNDEKLITDGIITKGIGGFYYVKTEFGVFESRARGVFREEKLTPIVGDKVQIRVSNEDETGYILKIYDRSSELLRPSVSNVTKSIIVMSVKDPEINLWLLDKFTLMSEYEGLETIICINKVDLDPLKSEEIANIYKHAGYRVIMASSKDDIGIDLIKEELKDNITVLSGPSGAGKSSILNKIYPKFDLEVGEVSNKTKRGKHTTRHVELLEVDKGSYVLDTPGFSSLRLDFIEDESEVREYFKEIDKYGEDCKFLSCLHDKEPGCNVKENVLKGNIEKTRYENYISIMEEVKKSRRY